MRINIWTVIILLASVTLLYAPFLWNPIIFDDLPFFMLDDAGGQPISNYRVSLLELRSLPYATLAWTKEWFGLDLIGFRVGNLLLHAAVALALYIFLSRLFSTVLGPGNDSRLSSRSAAFFSALIFALHPVATYAAGYLIQRTILMATLFGLLAMFAYLHGSVRNKPTWLWASVVFYYLAVFSKEHAIMLPGLLLALTALLHEDWRARVTKHWGIWCAFVGIALFAAVIQKGLLGSVYELNAPYMLQGTDGELSYPLSILTQSWLFFKYVGLWLYPNAAWMSVDMREPFAQSLLSSYLLAFVFYLAWGAGATWLLFKRGWTGLLGFALLFPWIMFFTEFSVVRIQESFVLYRSYLWMPGLVMVIALLFMKMQRKLAMVALGLICAMLVPVSLDRLNTFSHPLLLWDDAAKLVEGKPYLPGMERIYFNRGLALSKTKLKQESISSYSTAIRMKPSFSHAYNNRGAVLFEIRRYEEALRDFEATIALNPTYPNAHEGRGMVYEVFGNRDLAQESFYKSCALGKRSCEKLSEPMRRKLQDELAGRS
jgi:tetratricopeptide (TPR) repeat protein